VRNKIRNTIIPNLSELEKENLINEIKEKNKYLVDLKNRYQSFFLEEKHHLNCFSNLSIFDIQILLFTLIKRKNPECNKLSKSQVQEILDVLNSSKPNVIFSLGKNLSLIKEYDEWMISEDKIAEDYEYIISSPSKIDVEQFSCDLRGDLSFFKIYNDSYPLKIRNAKKDDVVYFGDVKKKINRIFIDEKIPLLKRKSYPIIQDKNEKIVYIPLYGSKEQKNIANKLQFVLK
jgi:tRNA(Ile)-lysidine synthase